MWEEGISEWTSVLKVIHGWEFFSILHAKWPVYITITQEHPDQQTKFSFKLVTGCLTNSLIAIRSKFTHLTVYLVGPSLLIGLSTPVFDQL